jgi:hypothetical protein
MSYEERGTWVYLLVSLGVYAAYVIVVLSRAADPITDTVYQAPLLWSIGAAILASIVLRIVVEIGAGVARGVGDEVAGEIESRAGVKSERPVADPFRADARDREIDRLGNQRTWIVAAAGALAAMLMALAEWPFFWIANVIYLGFVLQAVSSAIVKLVLYRRGF